MTDPPSGIWVIADLMAVVSLAAVVNKILDSNEPELFYRLQLAGDALHFGPDAE